MLEQARRNTSRHAQHDVRVVSQQVEFGLYLSQTRSRLQRVVTETQNLAENTGSTICCAVFESTCLKREKFWPNFYARPFAGRRKLCINWLNSCRVRSAPVLHFLSTRILLITALGKRTPLCIASAPCAEYFNYLRLFDGRPARVVDFHCFANTNVVALL